MARVIRSIGIDIDTYQSCKQFNIPVNEVCNNALKVVVKRYQNQQSATLD